MKRLILLGCLLVALFATGAQAQTTFSAQSGPWGSPSTWNGGALPASTDAVFILNGHTVSVDADRTVSNAVTISSGGELVIEQGITYTATSVAAGTKITVSSGGNLVQYGDLVVDAGGIGNSAGILVDVDSGGLWTIAGTGPVGDTDFVNGIAFADNQYPSTSLTFAVGAYSLPPGATHIRMLDGPLKNAIWPISAFSNRTLTVEHALLQGEDADLLIYDAETAADSLFVDDSVITPNEVTWSGSTLIQGDDPSEMVGRVERVFNENGTADRSTLFVDTEDAFVEGATEDTFILTWGMYVGLEFEYLDLALVRGGPAKPVTDYQTPYDPYSDPARDVGSDEALYIQCDGGLDWDYAAVVWLAAHGSGAANAIHSVGNNAGMSDWFIDDCAFYEIHGVNVLAYGANTANGVYVDQMFTWDMLGPDDGDHGHFGRLDGVNSLATFSITNSGFLKGQDDLFYAFNGGTTILEDSWVIGNLSGNILDIGNAGTYNITFNNVEGWGVGETPLTLDGEGTVATLDSDNVLMVNCGNAVGRNITDGHEIAGAAANTQGAMLFDAIAVPGLTLTNWDVRWATFNAVNFSQSNLEGTVEAVTLDGWTFANCANPRENQVAVAQPPGTVYNLGSAGEITAVITISGNSVPQLNNIVIKDSFRRGWDLGTAGMNGNCSVAVLLRGANDGIGCGVNIDGITVDGLKAYANGTRTTNGGGMAIHNNSDRTRQGGTLNNGYFEGYATPLYQVSSSPVVWNVSNTTFHIAAETINDEGVYLPGGAGGTHTFTGCLWTYNGNTRWPMRVPVSTDFVNCSFVDRTGAGFAYAIYYNSGTVASASSAVGTTIDGFTGPVTIAGVGNRTVAQMEASYNWSNTTDDGDPRYEQTGFPEFGAVGFFGGN